MLIIVMESEMEVVVVAGVWAVDPFSDVSAVSDFPSTS